MLGKSESRLITLFWFCFPAGKLFIAPLILVLGLALGAIAVVIGKKHVTYLRLDFSRSSGNNMSVCIMV